ncbi:hypothetical protein GOP47_0026543 [Adiantum capillus-veneris]|nr:hypothetical protein GOP47_0026543 [Adiantum capillus-veneris]
MAVRPRLRRLLLRRTRASVKTEFEEQSESESKAKAILRLVSPLSPKEVEYCNEACIARVLKAKGNQVNKAAKQLRATLAWRANIDIEYLTADEFSAELAQGSAYVAGHDDHGRPVLMVRLKPESLSNQSQKQFLRFMVFCMEVAIGCMPSAVEQCVLIFDACCLKKGTPGMSSIVQVLKLIGEHYPERVARTFIVDAPPVFYLLWKGIGKLFDLKMRKKLRFVFSRDYSSLGASSTANSSALIAATRTGTYSNRSLLGGDEQHSDFEEEHQKEDRGNVNSLTTSTETSTCTHLVSSTSDTLKPQTMQTPTSSSEPAITTLASLLSSSSFSLATSSAESVPLSSSSVTSKSLTTSTPSSSSLVPSLMSSLTSLPPFHRPTAVGAALPSDKSKARSLSFASRLTMRKEDATEFRSFRADTRPRRVREEGSSRRWTDLTFGFNKKEEFLSGHIEITQKDKNHALFRPYYTRFLSAPYSEAAYRAHMKPPLGGLISILGPDIKLRQSSFSLHTCSAMEAMLHHLHLD